MTQNDRDTHTGLSLAGRTALITGSGRGIGRGGAVCLARYGARVALVARTAAELEATAAVIKDEGGECLVLPADIRDPQAVKDAVRETEEAFGPVDILVNNAAVIDYVPFEAVDDDLWHRTIDVNLHGAYYCTREVYPQMLERRDGAIINVSSSAGYKGFVEEAAYCAGKFGMEGLAKSLALEGMEHNILVTLAVPGIRTKPTSVTEAQYQALDDSDRDQYADPMVMGEAFCFLAASRDLRLAGLRFDLYTLSRRVRDQGLDVDIDDVLEDHRGPR
ncbi:MAG: SDR family oxidoreductase [Thermaerobacterales bacterium]